MSKAHKTKKTISNSNSKEKTAPSESLSGPVFDRIDMVVEVPRVSSADLALPPSEEGSAEVQARVSASRALQRARFRRVDPENEAFKKLPEEKQKELMLQMLVDQITFAGHKAPPEVGAQARIYFGKRDGKRWEGTYPDWYDLIGKTKPEASKLRQQESGGSKAKAAIQKEQTEEPAYE